MLERCGLSKGKNPSSSRISPKWFLATLDNNYFSERKMIIENAVRQNIYEQILKTANKRLEQALPGSEGSFADLSLGRLLNLLFFLKGEWGTIGDYWTTHQALRALVGDDLLWADPQKASPPPAELVQ
jgi:hypothetical protein